MEAVSQVILDHGGREGTAGPDRGKLFLDHRAEVFHGRAVGPQEELRKTVPPGLFSDRPEREDEGEAGPALPLRGEIEDDPSVEARLQCRVADDETRVGLRAPL